MASRLHIVLFEPEIPQNTGNIGRFCAFTAATLHLIEPLGFSLDDKYLRRSGMDYWQQLEFHIHPSFQAFRQHPAAPQRLWLFTTHAKRSFWDAAFLPGDGLLFGNEGHGCPDWLHQTVGDPHRLTVPRFHPEPLRSLNLASSVAIAGYEAFRQFEFSPPNGH